MSGIKAKVSQLVAKVTSGEPVLDLHGSVNADTLWPTTLDEESDKAASILRSFFIDGFIVPYRTIGMVPQEILKTCHGLAIFHLLRNGLASPNASGSGVLVAKLPDGKWSPPAGILIDIGSDFPPNIDVLDVVLVIKDKIVLDTLTISDVAPGPIPESEAGAVHSYAKHDKGAAIWSYAKSKGELVDFDCKALKIREAEEENARFYGAADVEVNEILGGSVKGVDGYLGRTLRTLSEQKGDLSGLPKSGGCPGDRKIKAPVKGE